MYRLNTLEILRNCVILLYMHIYKRIYGDVLDLTGWSINVDCESERCSRLSTSKHDKCYKQYRNT